MTIQALIVEDNVELSEVLADILSLQGIQADIANDGRVASQKLTSTTPDFVLLDMHIPHISGQELLQQIRHSNRLPHTKIIVLTADVLLAGAVREQADATLTKPVGVEQLQETIFRLVPGAIAF